MLLTSARPHSTPLRARSQFEAALVRSTARHASAPAVLRDISPGTSYQAVRLVFRRYAQLAGPICTSGPLGASAGASPAVARARRSSPPFGPLRACSRVSGCARPPRSVLPTFRSRARSAPWSVFQDGPREAKKPRALRAACFAPFHSAPARLFSFPSRYFSSIGLSVYLALDGSLHRSLCRPAHSYSWHGKRRGTGLAPSVAPLPLASLALHAAHPRRFAAGRFPFARRYSGNPCSFLFLRVVICLSSAGAPTRVVRSGVLRPCLRGLSRACALPRADSPGVPRRRPCVCGVLVCGAQVPSGMDPSAGSPTETLLRLLSNLGTAAHARPRLPRAPISDSDGRCVQRTGTLSPRAGDPRVLGIPRSARAPSRASPAARCAHASRRGAPARTVARVQPAASKGITDLLSPALLRLRAGRPPS